MKSIKQTVLFAIILLGCVSCKNKAENDTLYISTMDQNLALEGGLSLGDTLNVSYTITEDEPGINIVSTAQKVH